jgi:hypothetical protein
VKVELGLKVRFSATLSEESEFGLGARAASQSSVQAEVFSETRATGSTYVQMRVGPWFQRGLRNGPPFGPYQEVVRHAGSSRGPEPSNRCEL